MNTRREIIILAMVLMGLCFIQAVTACPPPPPFPIPPTVIQKCGTLTADETWESGKTYYVTCDVIVPSGITLTIEPGCIVKFDGRSLKVSPDGGTLIAEGTPANFIIFTSKYDCTVGEKLVSTGVQIPELWGEIIINRNCRVSFCKISCAVSGLRIIDHNSVEGAVLTIRDNIIRMCRHGVIPWYVSAEDYTVDIFNNLITDNTNGCGIYLPDNYHSILNIHNNTIDNCYLAISTYNYDESTIYNNLISNCNEGIVNRLPSFEPVCFYNAFFNTNLKFEGVSPVNRGTNNVEPTVSPFASCVLGDYYLNEDADGGALLIDAGYDPCNLGMPGYTTQLFKLNDEAPIDIGFHYPFSYLGYSANPSNPGPIPMGSTGFISGGKMHSLFVKSDSSVWACGTAYTGTDEFIEQVPDKVLQGAKNYPIDNAYLEGIAFVDAGGSHSLAVDSNGYVWTWGNNGNAALGIGYMSSETLGPVQVLDHDGTGYLSNIVKVAAGQPDDYSLALDFNGNVWAWGKDSASINDMTSKDSAAGRLGIGTAQYDYCYEEISKCYVFTPHKVLGGQMGTDFLEGVTDIDAGSTHSIACDINGNVWTWGWNGHGELGNGQNGWFEEHYTPVKVLAGEMNTSSGYLENIVDVAVTCFASPDDRGPTSYALDSNGHVWAWGSGWEGQLGDNNEVFWQDPNNDYWWHWQISTPIQVKCGDMNTPSGYLENIVSISAGYGHILALDRNGYVWAWGLNDNNLASGQIGNGGVCDTGYAYDPYFEEIFSFAIYGVKAPDKVQKSESEGGGYLSDIIAIDAGFGHSMAIDKNGDVWTWGNSGYYQLGLSSSSGTRYKARKITSWSY